MVRRIENGKTLILKLEGGLGNQLFELAAGYFLAAKTRSTLVMDQYAIPLTTAHGEKSYGFDEFLFELNNSSSNLVVLRRLPSKIEINLAKNNLFLKKVLLKSRQLSLGSFFMRTFKESNDPNSALEILKIDFPVKLFGNFQSWKVVESAAEYGFPRQLQLRQVPNWIKEFGTKIDFQESLLVHFRVGSDTRTNINFVQPSPIYYLEAIKKVSQIKAFKALYYVCDDVENFRHSYGSLLEESANLIEFPEYSSPAQRLYFMSLFGSIVCANSTFCGWAAWGIYNRGGQVVVPVPYSNGPVPGSRDFPKSWIQLNKHNGEGTP